MVCLTSILSCILTPLLALGEKAEYERYEPGAGVSLTSRKRREEEEEQWRIGPGLVFFCRFT